MNAYRYRAHHALKRAGMLLAAVTLLLLMAAAAPAKSGSDKAQRTEFYGLVQALPENSRIGEWLIGGRTVVADAQTEFDQSEGQLKVGACAKVHLRDGRVHEIDSEPLSNCP